MNTDLSEYFLIRKFHFFGRADRKLGMQEKSPSFWIKHQETFVVNR